MNFSKKALLALSMGIAAAAAGNANAANVNVNANIATSTTWTASNVYALVGPIYVLPGATLSIEPGTLIATVPGSQGTLVVCRGAKIYANGTKANPIIFTSTNDVATWTAGNPKTGVWRSNVNQEWGNIAILGKGLISASHYGGLPVARPAGAGGGFNTKDPSGLNIKLMEALVPTDGNDLRPFFGGNDDNDNSGTLSYVSLRYGGKVLDPAIELNGLSLGGVGRQTDIHHIDIMNNIDDGIEIWGGTVNIKYANIWNIGDDSFDLDEGWRGKAQFGLIVQGASGTGSQGGGVGDNIFEHDGAEDSDAQPVTTAVIYNFTAIGQPNTSTGDHGTAWRDNARVQYRNCIFMNLGEKLIALDNVDGDGAQGYGYNGTTTWTDTWTTPYSTTSTVNAAVAPAVGAFNHPATMYQAQTSGFLAEMTDSVFYANANAAAYTESDLRGVTLAGGSNPAKNNVVATTSPIVSITRGTSYIQGSKTIQPVISLDPRAQNDAAASAATAPADGFFTPAPYRGAFSPSHNWAKGWTAADAYGFLAGPAEADPASATINLTASTSFQTSANVYYSVEASTDMVKWAPIGTIKGDGTVKSITDLAGFSSAKFYRAIAQ